MDFVQFPEANRNLGAPAGMSAAECGTLPVYADGRQCISYWMPSANELAALNAGGGLYLGVLTSTDPNQPVYTQPPVFMTATAPHMPKLVYDLTPEMETALQEFAERLPIPAHVDRVPTSGAALVAEFPGMRGPDGEEMEPDKLYYVGGKANTAYHLRQLKGAYTAGGKAAVVQYLQPYTAYLPQ